LFAAPLDPLPVLGGDHGLIPLHLLDVDHLAAEHGQLDGRAFGFDAGQPLGGVRRLSLGDGLWFTSGAGDKISEPGESGKGVDEVAVVGPRESPPLSPLDVEL
jgi:hypothetical protein